MNSKNSGASNPHRLLLSLADKRNYLLHHYYYKLV